MKIWKTVEVDRTGVEDLAVELSLPAPLVCCMRSRGVTGAEQIDRFLKPRLSDLSDPFSLPGMQAAVDRIWDAIEARDPVAVYGDYDVDGISGTGVMIRVLSRLGACVTPYIPRRMEDGYGLSVESLGRCLEFSPARLVITVDCGTSSHDAIAFARQRGVDVIVSDHHEIAGTPAPALAVVNPKLGGGEDVRMLAGVGVAFKLCHGVIKAGRDRGYPAALDIDLRDYIEWVAVGTVADAVPLTSENRILVSHGLERLNNTRSAGLRALIEVSGIASKLTSYHLGFVLGPRINAAGRVGDAQAAMELLLTDDPARACSLAATLDAANSERKRIEDRIVDEVNHQLGVAFDAAKDCCLVVSGAGWHVGVIGIVASRLCARHYRPVVVVAFEEGGRGRGSCRSIGEFDLMEGLGACSELLAEFGGHSLAAGLWIDESRFQEFRRKFNEIATAKLRGLDLRPTQRIDSWIEFGAADEVLMRGIEMMSPFGCGNPAPIWGVRGALILGQPRVVGKGHLKMLLGGGGRQRDAIGFNLGDRDIPDGPIDVAFTLERNSFRGMDSLQFNVQDFRPSEPV